MRRLSALVAFVVLMPAAHPVPARAWGLEVHRLLTGLALDGVPRPLASLYSRQRAFIVEHSVDPDLWRTADLRGAMGPEDPNHFFNIDTLDEPAPYARIPRTWAAFRARYGTARANRAGRLPFRTVEIYDRLVKAFAAMKRGSSYGADDACYLSAVLAHYVEDGHQPLHATANYDGQLSGQRGVHSRFETALPQRTWTRLAHPAVRVQPVPDLAAFMFSALARSAADVPAVLEADRHASQGLSRDAGGHLVYDDRYYERFLTGIRPVLEERLSSAASGVASVLVSAWRDAGSPDIPAH